MNGQKTMLIADDVCMNRRILKDIFGQEYTIYEAKDGIETISQIEAHKEELTIVLLDICMPGCSGVEVLEYIQKDEELKEIPVIAVTGEAVPETEILEKGAWDYVSRPFDEKLVKIRVENTVSRKLLADFKEQQRKLEAELEIRELEKKHLESLKRENALLQERTKEQERYKFLTQQTGSVVFELNFQEKKIYISENINELVIGRRIFFKNTQILREDNILEWVMQKIDQLHESEEGVYEEDKEKLFHEFFKPLMHGESYAKTTVRLEKESGGYAWSQIAGNCFYDYTGQLERVIGTIKDVNNEVEYLNKLKRDAEYDPLTGTYNKRAFYLYVNEMLCDYPDEQFAILRLDINRFKVVNELFGHQRGDCLIGYIANKLRDILSFSKKNLFARMEADIFCICMVYQKDEFETQLEKLEHIADEYEIDFDVVPSIGIYIIKERNILVEVMCDRAKLAQDTIKGNYLKRHAYFDEKLHKNLIREQEIINMMNQALEREEFQVYLQPKFNLNSNSICGAEALVRWYHPEKGMIYPNEFIPVFERNGFIMKLDEYVWEKVCRFLRKEMDEGKNIFPISVNISRVDLYNPKLCDIIIGLVEKYQIPIEYFQLELTESAYTDNKNLLNDVMGRLQNYGFVMMMDDFGSGYSSLNMLKEIPVDVLKVDLRFLSDDGDKGKGGSIISSVIRMAKWLNLQVVTEGIETQNQVDFLRSIGCTDGQGFYFAKPMPLDEFEHMVVQGEGSNFADEKRKVEGIDIDVLWNPNSDLRLLFNGMVSAVGIYEINRDNLEALRLSDSYFEMVGTSREKFVGEGLHIMECILEEDEAVVKKMFQTAFESKGVGEGTYRRKKADGEIIWLHTKVTYIAGDEKGSIYFAIMNDITKEKRYEEELAAALEKLNMMSAGCLE